MARKKTIWFSEDGKPILNDGLYMNPGGDQFCYHFKYRGRIFKGKTGTPVETKARKRIEQLKAKADNEHFGVFEADPITLHELWEKWDELHGSQKSPSHRRYMQGVVHQHTGEYQHMDASKLDNLAVQTLKAAYLGGTGQGQKNWKGGLAPEGQSAHTIRKHSEGGWNKVLTQLRALVRWGARMKLLGKAPFDAKGMWERPSEKAKPVLWPEQVAPFLAAIDKEKKVHKGDLFPHSAIAARLMLGLGVRESESLNLEWDRVDWRRDVAVIAEASSGKKVKDRALREVPIPAWLRGYLLKWWAFLGHPTAGLLMVAKTKKAHGEGGTGCAIEKAGALIKIAGLTPHALRRTFATGHWEIGTPLSQIAQMMGHENPDVTRKHYIIERPKDQAQSQEKLALAFGITTELPPQDEKKQ